MPGQVGEYHTQDCPPGYRLLCQVDEGTSEIESRLWLADTFGEKKEQAAVLHRGIWVHEGARQGTQRRFDSKRGFRAYLPVGFKT